MFTSTRITLHDPPGSPCGATLRPRPSNHLMFRCRLRDALGGWSSAPSTLRTAHKHSLPCIANTPPIYLHADIIHGGAGLAWQGLARSQAALRVAGISAHSAEGIRAAALHLAAAPLSSLSAPTGARSELPAFACVAAAEMRRGLSPSVGTTLASSPQLPPALGRLRLPREASGWATQGLVVAAAAGNKTGRGSRLRSSTPKAGTSTKNRDWAAILGDRQSAWRHTQAATVADTEEQDSYDYSYNFSAEIFSDEAANDLLHHSLKVRELGSDVGELASPGATQTSSTPPTLAVKISHRFRVLPPHRLRASLLREPPSPWRSLMRGACAM